MSKSRQDARREHYMHRLSYSTRERLVGVFILSGLILIMLTIFASSKTQHLFEERFIIYGTIKTAEGVNRGTTVRISGIDVGEVINIEIEDDNKIRITMEILSRFRTLLREDSKARLGKLSLLGQASVEISAGSTDVPIIPEKTVLAIEEIKTLDDLIAEITPVIETVITTIDRLSGIMAAINPEDIEATVSNMSKISENMLQLTQNFENDSGFMATLLRDEAFDQDLKASASSLRSALKDMPQLVSSLSQTSQQVSQLLGNSSSTVQSDIMLKIKVTLDELDKTLKGIQRIWPISSAVGPQSVDSDQLIPAEGAHH